MRLRQTAPPAAEPLTLDEAKAHLRITHTGEDSLVTAMLAAARIHLEGHGGRQGILGRSLITRTYALTLDEFPPSRRLDLPQPPLQSVASIVYRDAADVERTLSASLYDVVTDDLTGYVQLHRNQSWPATADRDDAVIVTFTAGYGAASSDVPEPIRHAIRLHLSHLYMQRGDDTGGAKPLPGAYDVLIANYRLGGWI